MIENVIEICMLIYNTLWLAADTLLDWLSADIPFLEGISKIIAALPDWVVNILDPAGLIADLANLSGSSPISLLFGVGLVTCLGYALFKFLWPNS